MAPEFTKAPLAAKTMETEPIPANWEAIACSEFAYWWGMDILEHHWTRTQSFADQTPGSDEHMEFLFWRRIAVIWACSTIEAFVNSEGTASLGEGFYKDNLERLHVVKKIHVIYAFKYRARLPRKLGRLNHVVKLFDLRNSLVHPKTREESTGQVREKEPLDELWTMDFTHLRRVFWTVTALFEPAGVGETDDEATNDILPENHGKSATSDAD